MAHIEQVFGELRGFNIPPLAQWHPQQSLDIDLRIAADGRWYHQGAVIARHRLVKLFGSVLRLEQDGRHYLITPHLKYPVTVDDAPFQAVEVSRQGNGKAQNLFFRTNLDDIVLADATHPLNITTDRKTEQVSPYIEVRDGLQAKLSRPVYYELAQLLQPPTPNPNKILGLYSAGQFFPFGHTQ